MLHRIKHRTSAPFSSLSDKLLEHRDRFGEGWVASALARHRAAYLMVPVGEGTGLTKLRRSGSGIWILRGEICG